jgi:enoyl-CoA hydratase/carnithine racemase
LADFFEGFIPLLIYRRLKLKPAGLKKPSLTYGLTLLLVADMVVSAVATVFTFPEVSLFTFASGISVLGLQAAVEDHKTWLS